MSGTSVCFFCCSSPKVYSDCNHMEKEPGELTYQLGNQLFMGGKYAQSITYFEQSIIHVFPSSFLRLFLIFMFFIFNLIFVFFLMFEEMMIWEYLVIQN